MKNSKVSGLTDEKAAAVLSAAARCGGANNVQKIADELGMSESEVQKILKYLEVKKSSDSQGKKKRKRSNKKTGGFLPRKKLDI